MTPNMREFIKTGRNLNKESGELGASSFSEDRLKRVAIQAGYQPYAFSVRELLIEGVISPSEALRCLGLSFRLS